MQTAGSAERAGQARSEMPAVPRILYNSPWAGCRRPGQGNRFTYSREENSLQEQHGSQVFLYTLHPSWKHQVSQVAKKWAIWVKSCHRNGTGTWQKFWHILISFKDLTETSTLQECLTFGTLYSQQRPRAPSMGQVTLRSPLTTHRAHNLTVYVRWVSHHWCERKCLYMSHNMSDNPPE